MLETSMGPIAEKETRLRMPLALVALYWTSFIVFHSLDKLYFIAFLFALIAPALLVLAYGVWWWTNRSIPLAERSVGFVLILAGGVLVEPFCDTSVGVWGLVMMGPPLVLTAWTAWLAASRNAAPGLRKLTALLTVAAAWAVFTAVRVEVPKGDLFPVLFWRWLPTPEDLYLAEKTGPSAHADWRPTLRPGDWPQFRGPQRDGIVHGAKIRTDWDQAPPLVWKQRIGPGWSSMTIVNGRLFTQEQKHDKECVVCYDARTGALIWSHEDSARFKGPPAGDGPRATPSFADGVLVTLGATGIVNGLDPATGKLLWTRNSAVDANAQPPQWGYSSSPLLVNGLAIVFAGGKDDAENSLLAYRLTDGSPVWSAAAGQVSYSSPQLLEIAGQRLCLMSSDLGLIAFDPATGAVRWKTGTESPKTPRALMPQKVGDHQVLIGTLEGASVTLLDLVPKDATWDVSRRFTSNKLSPEFSDLVVHNGYAYGFDVTTFCCLDLEKGKLRWKAGRYGRGEVLLLPEQNLLVVISEDGEAILLSANPERPEELGRFQALGEKDQRNPTWNHPALVDNRLYVRNAQEIACYDLSAK